MKVVVWELDDFGSEIQPIEEAERGEDPLTIGVITQCAKDGKEEVVGRADYDKPYWIVNVDSLDDIFALVRKYGDICIRPSPFAEIDYGIEI